MKFFKQNRNGKILNVLLSIIALFVIIFVIFWIVNKSNNSASLDETFNVNLNNMQETAKTFFASDLPTEIGDEKTLTLEEMIYLNLSDKLTYGKTVCDINDSYISITKLTTNEYQVKSNLVCGDKQDDVIEKIKINTVIEDENGNTIVDDSKEDVKVEVNKNDKDNSTSDICNKVSCKVVRIDADCKTTYEWEYVKRGVSCADGFTYSNGKCVKTSDLTKEPTSKTAIKAAKVNDGKEYKVYSDAIESETDGYYKCTSGTLSGKYCYHYTNKVTVSENSCPSGYTKSGNYCYKYSDPVTSTTSTCPSGYTKSGNYCYKYAEPVTSTTSACPSGYTKSGNYCYKYADPTVNNNTTYSCSSGTLQGDKCIKTVSATKSYTAWGNPTNTYQTYEKESTYTNELTKKVLVGQTTLYGKTIYTYSTYSRKAYYSCSQGTLDGTKCIITSNATKNNNSTTTCPSGYTKDGNTCYIKTNLQTNTNTTCPSGYTKNGSTCYKVTNLETTSTTSCKAGYTQSGNTCYIRVKVTKDSYTTCPSGYTESGNKCYVRTKASYVDGITSYSCEKGYTKTGTGKNTKCYKLVKSDATMYCEDSNATLKDGKCYLDTAATYCEDGYVYSDKDKLCHKTSSEEVNPIYNIVDVKYSSASSLDGYQKTGKANYKMVCTRIEETKIYK